MARCATAMLAILAIIMVFTGHQQNRSEKTDTSEPIRGGNQISRNWGFHLLIFLIQWLVG